MTAYYNEFDPKAAAWLRELIKEGHIAYGEVDERSITEVRPTDLAGYTQCHFFAGIGGWSYALRLAGWPDDRPVWTGSCPCQPFSAAGRRGGTDDDRHLWPEFYRLISECRPTIIFGEQVASKDGLAWLDIVSTDLEGASYAVGAADLCAAGVGAPHIRQRLYFVADSGSERLERQRLHLQSGQPQFGDFEAGRCGEVGELGHACEPRTGRDAGTASSAQTGVRGQGDSDGRNRGNASEPASAVSDLADASSQQQHRSGNTRRGRREFTDGCDVGNPDDAGSQGRRIRWDGTGERTTWTADLVGCRDGKWRPVEPGLFPLAHGVPGRVGLLRGYGNAIVPQVAAEFIKAAHYQRRR